MRPLRLTGARDVKAPESVNVRHTLTRHVSPAAGGSTPSTGKGNAASSVQTSSLTRLVNGHTPLQSTSSFRES